MPQMNMIEAIRDAMDVTLQLEWRLAAFAPSRKSNSRIISILVMTK